MKRMGVKLAIDKDKERRQWMGCKWQCFIHQFKVAYVCHDVRIWLSCEIYKDDMKAPFEWGWV